MRHLALIGTLALATALTSLAHAGWLPNYVKIHGTSDHLDWHTADGRALDLSSKNGRGVEVVKITPDDRANLHQGDFITAVNGQAVVDVVDLVTYANAHMQDPATLSLRRAGHDVDVKLAASELGKLMHPQP